MTYMAMPLNKNPCPGGYEIYNFGWPFLGHHYYILSLYGPFPEVERKFLKRKTSILHFLPQIYRPWGGGDEIYNFLSPYPTYETKQNWSRLAFWFLKRKC